MKRVPLRAASGRDQVARARRLELEVLAVVADQLEHQRHVQRRVHARGLGERAPEQHVLLQREALDRIRGLDVGRERLVVVRQVGEQPDRRAQRAQLVRGGEVAHPVHPVHPGPPQVVGRHVLAQRRLHHARPGQPDEGVVALDHERALARQVGAAAGVVPEHQADRRNQSADLAQRREGLAVAVQAADARRHEGAGRVVHADQRQAPLSRHVDQTRELRPVGGVHGAGAQGEVVAVDGDVAAAHLDDPGDDRGAVEVRPPVLEEQVGLALGEHLDALEHRHAALGVLHAHAARAASPLRSRQQLPAQREGLVVATVGRVAGVARRLRERVF
jgi:hypothetical protein